jgi:hypothetical protein
MVREQDDLGVRVGQRNVMVHGFITSPSARVVEEFVLLQPLAGA